MGIVFFCQACGARFEVEERLAGKKGRCKYCGQVTIVPKAEHLSAVFSLKPLSAPGHAYQPELSRVRHGGSTEAPATHSARRAPAQRAAAIARARAPVDAAAPAMPGWLEQSMSKIGLAPITADQIAIGRKPGRATSPLDTAADLKPYSLVKPDRREAHRARGGRPAGFIARLWRGNLGTIQKLFRWLNQSAYVVSVPFIIIFLFGAAIKDRNIALFGARFVVLLNVWAFCAGIGNLVIVPLRDGLNPRKLKQPLRRIAEPVVTTAIVLLALSFVPWLRSGESRSGTIAERLRAGARDLENEVQGQVGAVVDKAKHIDFDKLRTEAREKLDGLTEKAKAIDLSKLGAPAQEGLQKSGAPSGDGRTSQSEPEGEAKAAKAEVRSLIKNAKEALNASKEQP
jgi:DNA-directed RNA polymerase subunit RPC12/RpoP